MLNIMYIIGKYVIRNYLVDSPILISDIASLVFIFRVYDEYDQRLNNFAMLFLSIIILKSIELAKATYNIMYSMMTKYFLKQFAHNKYCVMIRHSLQKSPTKNKIYAH